mmetsp:Transcript_6416/g.19410  ORF Transcript_6416/g.19410 Transcript_6416/m.19410 type:complete len:121 (-) Transcript_6416:608-970(-)
MQTWTYNVKAASNLVPVHRASRVGRPDPGQGNAPLLGAFRPISSAITSSYGQMHPEGCVEHSHHSQLPVCYCLTMARMSTRVLDCERDEESLDVCGALCVLRCRLTQLLEANRLLQAEHG